MITCVFSVPCVVKELGVCNFITMHLTGFVLFSFIPLCCNTN